MKQRYCIPCMSYRHGNPRNKTCQCECHGKKPSEAERFWIKVQKSDGCWMWTGALDIYGYGHFRRSDGKLVYAHRWSYEQHKGAIADGFEIDHLCHNSDASCKGFMDCQHHGCVRPDHLEAVTHRENINRSPLAQSRKTHCPQGHEYAGENLKTDARGYRHCRACESYKGRRVLHST